MIDLGVDVKQALVDALEKDIESALRVVFQQAEAPEPGRRTLHLMAKAATAVFEATVEKGKGAGP